MDDQLMQCAALDAGPFYHGTKADLSVDQMLQTGFRSNFGRGQQANFVYLTATLKAAMWGAELADGDGPGSIRGRSQPHGKEVPREPTRSYRTRQPLGVVGEILDWVPQPPEMVQGMRERVEDAKQLGIEAINE
jgi:Rifampin ADP-ribosyl transferase